MEYQSDKFAGYLLYPFAGLNHLNVNSARDLNSRLKLSLQSSSVAFENLQQRLNNRNIKSIHEFDPDSSDLYDSFIYHKYQNSREKIFYREKWAEEKEDFLKEFAVLEDAHWDRLMEDFYK